jgi:hypothetical protein
VRLNLRPHNFPVAISFLFGRLTLAVRSLKRISLL